MPDYNLVVVGPQVVGGGQRHLVRGVYDLGGLISALEGVVVIDQPGCPPGAASNTVAAAGYEIHTVSVFDTEFAEFVCARAVGDIPAKAKIKVECTPRGAYPPSPMRAHESSSGAGRASGITEQIVSFYSHVCDRLLLPAVETLTGESAARLSTQVAEAFVAASRVPQENWASLPEFQVLHAAVEGAVRRASGGQSQSQSYAASTSGYGAAAAAAPQTATAAAPSYDSYYRRASAEAGTGGEDSAMPLKASRKAARPGAAEADASSVAVAAVSAAATATPLRRASGAAATPAAGSAATVATALRRTSAAAAGTAAVATPLTNGRSDALVVAPTAVGGGGSPTLIVYCVYSGTTCQRAKAIRVDRYQPRLAPVLDALKAKFRKDLSLGVIEADGAWSEVLTDADFARITSSVGPAADSVTMHCWAKAPVVVEGHVYASDDEASVARSRGRPASAGSRRAGSAAGSASSKRNPLDVSGACYTEEQIREIFDELDTSDDGFLDREELWKYFISRYDPMGIDAKIIEKKFNDMLAGLGEAFADGKISYNEFGIVMLKLAQW